MAETKSAPPYEQAAPYGSSTAPPQPMMHQDTGNFPQSPPPQAYPQSPPPAAYPQDNPYHAPQAGVAQIAHAGPSPMHSPPPFQPEQKGSFYPQPQPGQQGAEFMVPIQGGMAMGPMGQQSQYHTATPLQNLSEGAAPVDCPSCRSRALTRTEYVSGNTAMGWAALLCFCCCLGCIPFMMRSLKDVEHHCGKCGVLLATWHNSGRTVVHVHG